MVNQSFKDALSLRYGEKTFLGTKVLVKLSLLPI